MTQIYGTFGPACTARETLLAMLQNGLTGMRLNMSHCSLLESNEQLKTFRSAAEEVGVVPQLLIDMQGPELRIGTFEPIHLEDGAEQYLGKDGIEIPKVLFSVMCTGDEVLLDDGKISLEVLSVGTDYARTRIVRGGTINSRKSIKITGKNIPLPVSTQQDVENIRLAKTYGVTGIMQPFVRNGQDLVELRRTLQKNDAEHLQIFAKIESMEGVANLDSILPETDAVIIARGDLGNDMPLWKLPAVQKDISVACRKAGKPFVVVTQMLSSMEQNLIPTRAEVSDIFNAVADGAYGVMLTNETAVGAHPAEAISYLALTSADAKRWMDN